MKKIEVLCIIVGIYLLTACAPIEYYDTYYFIGELLLFLDEDPESLECDEYEIIPVIQEDDLDYRGINCENFDHYVWDDGKYIELYKYLDRNDVDQSDLIDSGLFYKYSTTSLAQEVGINLQQLTLIEVRDRLQSSDYDETFIDIEYVEIEDLLQTILEHEIGFEHQLILSPFSIPYGPQPEIFIIIEDGTRTISIGIDEHYNAFIQSISDDSELFFYIAMHHGIETTIQALFETIRETSNSS